MINVANKVAIVTGAGSGVGKAIAVLHGVNGAKVVVSDVNRRKGIKTVEEIKSKGGEAIFIKADTSIPEDQKSLVENTLKHFGALHIACNNSSIKESKESLGEYPNEGWQDIIISNLEGAYYGMHYQIPALLASGGGSIVNIASVLGKIGNKSLPAYVANKTHVAALELANQKIRVNAIGPGYINTPLNRGAEGTDSFYDLAGLHPIGHLSTPEEVAELTLWLSSPVANFVSGFYYIINGEYSESFI
ncbi:MAG: SDR family oxidoreductase [bacterium]|nr:SDR family oxidoreductase [bacterium]